MPEVSYTATIDVGRDAVWQFVKDLNNWAPFAKGYQSHEIINDDDLFKFTAPATDFVTIRADGMNSARRAGDGTPLDTQIKIFDASGALIAQSSGDGEVRRWDIGI